MPLCSMAATFMPVLMFPYALNLRALRTTLYSLEKTVDSF